MNGKFRLNFLMQPNKTEVNLIDWEHYFLEYTPEKWQAEVTGGTFSYFDTDGKRYGLHMAHSAEHGICLWYYASENDVDYVFYVSVADKDDQDIIDIGSDELYNAGGFIPPAKAWLVVKQFLTNPTELPQAPYMMDIEETNWPEIQY